VGQDYLLGSMSKSEALATRLKIQEGRRYSDMRAFDFRTIQVGIVPAKPLNSATPRTTMNDAANSSKEPARKDNDDPNCRPPATFVANDRPNTVSAAAPPTATAVPNDMAMTVATPTPKEDCDNANTRKIIAPEHGRLPAASMTPIDFQDDRRVAGDAASTAVNCD
jgi:hypothetical protein